MRRSFLIQILLTVLVLSFLATVARSATIPSEGSCSVNYYLASGDVEETPEQLGQ